MSPFAGRVSAGDTKQDPLLGLIVDRQPVVFAATRTRKGRKVVKRKSAVWPAGVTCTLLAWAGSGLQGSEQEKCDADIKVFAENLEDSTKEQIEEISSCSAFEGAKIRIMPDAHKGKGCVIGFTANLGDKVIPNLVGVDIGCGMYCAPLAETIARADLIQFNRDVKRAVPTGFCFITILLRARGLWHGVA